MLHTFVFAVSWNKLAEEASTAASNQSLQVHDTVDCSESKLVRNVSMQEDNHVYEAVNPGEGRFTPVVLPSSEVYVCMY